ncbi:unnamed protein product [Arabis nemorensis]|uniref:Uncharacterized protein n=1 Tax=Arabis nemorensis TaxID=586526 RepID=A0A565ANH3_9BRAS|nr:unnamed protein product [Arabis nemorensis]
MEDNRPDEKTMASDLFAQANHGEEDRLLKPTELQEAFNRRDSSTVPINRPTGWSEIVSAIHYVFGALAISLIVFLAFRFNNFD